MLRDHKQRRPTAIDLFSGCGGLTLGLKQAGFDVVGAVESNSIAADTYKVNHPEVHLWPKDIRGVTGPELLRKLKIRKGQLDLLAGCPPCQGFSAMRTRNGKKRVRDRRNDLVFDYLRLVKALRPRTVMMENVPALKENRRMKIFQKKLEAMGYVTNGTPIVLNTASYGVPQRRKRMILLASRIGAIKLPAESKVIRTVRQAIEAMPRPGNTGDPLHDLKERRAPRIAELIKLIPKDGGSRSDLPKRFRLACHENFSGFADVYGRMKWDDVAPTITGGCFNPSKGRFLHPSQNRAISLREASLLQAFPRSYYFSLDGGKEVAALMIGNALPPTFIRKHALAIRAALLSS
ncbi:MAG: DNA cytosine methyltransferase [Reyranella sp.]|nr:DNA cytosine methyltransferase [Parvibaculum sp.]MCF8533581.1 DNA cytosine methyltransferase [Reyranella sp.]